MAAPLGRRLGLRRDLALAMACNRGTGTPIGDLRMAQLGTVLDRAARRRGPSAP